jgi:hypothetical protein
MATTGDLFLATEAERIIAFRFGRCLELELPVDLAERVSESSVDLHRLEDLIRAGCLPRLAAEILL